MENFIVLDVTGLTPVELDRRMNEIDKEGYKLVFQSDITWYQGRGEYGVICFEFDKSKEELIKQIKHLKKVNNSLFDEIGY